MLRGALRGFGCFAMLRGAFAVLLRCLAVLCGDWRCFAGLRGTLRGVAVYCGLIRCFVGLCGALGALRYVAGVYGGLRGFAVVCRSAVLCMLWGASRGFAGPCGALRCSAVLCGAVRRCAALCGASRDVAELCGALRCLAVRCFVVRVFVLYWDMLCLACSTRGGPGHTGSPLVARVGI